MKGVRPLSETVRNKLELLTTALSYLEDNLTEKINTEDVAKACYCSKSTLEKLFRCVSQMSVHEYVIRRRMTKAAKLLFYHREINILDVAVLYGYNSNEAFTRAFRQMWNCAPSEFRARTRYFELFPKLSFHLDEGEQIMKKVDISELYDLLRQRIGCYYIICDISNQIRINEIARAAGDLAIVESLNRMNSVAGENDVVVRIGGDEFALLTDSKDEGYAQKLVAEIEAKNGMPICYEGREIPLSLYVVCRALDNGDYQTASDLQLEMQDKVKQLTDLYIIYKKNLF
jgi:AraC family transcriptional regulator